MIASHVLLQRRLEKLLWNALPRLFVIVGNSFSWFLVCLARVTQIVENAKFWTFPVEVHDAIHRYKCPKLGILYDLWNSCRADQKTTEGVANNWKKSWESISQAVFLNAGEAKHAVIQKIYSNHVSIHTSNFNCWIWNLKLGLLSLAACIITTYIWNKKDWYKLVIFVLPILISLKKST